MPNSTSKKTVKHRKVFFISGYDPKGPGWYHGLFVRQAKLQAELSGMRLDVSNRANIDATLSLWTIQGQENGHQITSQYVFLRWDDIVRKSWTRGTLAMMGVVSGNLYNYLRNGILWRLLGTSWITFNAAFYPSAFVLMTIIAGLLTGWGIATIIGISGWLSILLVLVIAAGFATVVLPILDRKFVIYWMSRIFAFNLKQGQGEVEGLRERTGQFANLITQAANTGDFDEIVVVGHSTGCQLAVSVLATAIKAKPDIRLSFMTLGSSIAMMAWVKEAGWFCDQLEQVANHHGIEWIDFSATQDGASFTLFDPVEGSGLQHANAQDKKPKLLSIKMFQLFSPVRFKKIRHNWNRVHFQYLCASEVLGDYDYFAIVAGCKTMTERFEHRQTTRDFTKYRIKRLYRPVPKRSRAKIGDDQANEL